LHTIDWEQQKRAVIQRVLERGNEIEINEILTFYGRELISKELPFIKESRLPSFRQNIETYRL
jgi:antitoxin HigA-1